MIYVIIGTGILAFIEVLIGLKLYNMLNINYTTTKNTNEEKGEKINEVMHN